MDTGVNKTNHITKEVMALTSHKQSDIIMMPGRNFMYSFCGWGLTHFIVLKMRSNVFLALLYP